MGSASSKAKTIRVPAGHTSSEHKPDVVANVNKLESLSPTTAEKQGFSNKSVLDTVEFNTSGEKDRTFKTNDKNKTKKERNNQINIVNREYINDTALVFEDDSDLEDNIDEVLKIPVAVDNSNPNKDKDKKRREQKKDTNNYDKQHESEPNTEVFTNTQVTLPVPETYVQRMQRQQYKFQHKLLLRDKEVIRNPREWQQDNEENNIIDSYQMQFDATKFREANRGSDPKKDLFTTTEPEDQGTTHYLQPSQQSFDDFEWAGKEDALPIKQLPRYNQSELDLMKELEDEAL